MAENSVGVDTKEISIDIKRAPVVKVIPKQVQITENNMIKLECLVENADGDYSVFWDDGLGKRSVSRVIKRSVFKLSDFLFDRLGKIMRPKQPSDIIKRTSRASSKLRNLQ